MLVISKSARDLLKCPLTINYNYFRGHFKRFPVVCHEHTVFGFPVIWHTETFKTSKTFPKRISILWASLKNRWHLPLTHFFSHVENINKVTIVSHYNNTHICFKSKDIKLFFILTKDFLKDQSVVKSNKICQRLWHTIKVEKI